MSWPGAALTSLEHQEPTDCSLKPLDIARRGRRKRTAPQGAPGTIHGSLVATVTGAGNNNVPIPSDVASYYTSIENGGNILTIEQSAEAAGVLPELIQTLAGNSVQAAMITIGANPTSPPTVDLNLSAINSLLTSHGVGASQISALDT